MRDIIVIAIDSHGATMKSECHHDSHGAWKMTSLRSSCSSVAEEKSKKRKKRKKLSVRRPVIEPRQTHSPAKANMLLKQKDMKGRIPN